MKKSFKTPLKKVRGLGSSHSGTHHWYSMRLTSMALLPLSLWFIFGFLTQLESDRDSWFIALKNPAAALGLMLFLGFSVHHGQAGFQVIVEDYVHCDMSKRLILLTVKGLALVLFGWGLLNILRLHLMNH